jgi:hypothetical protein
VITNRESEALFETGEAVAGGEFESPDADASEE